MTLLKRGIGAVSVEAIARELGVTKGSFYWHFKDRPALLEALLVEWENEADLLIGAIGPTGVSGVRALMEQVQQNVFASERGEVPSDAAIFSWAAVDPTIAERVNAAEEERIGLLAALLGSREKAEIAYMAYLGFVLRRRHGEDPAGAFALVADLFELLASQDPRKDVPQKERDPDQQSTSTP